MFDVSENAIQGTVARVPGKRGDRDESDESIVTKTRYGRKIVL